MVWSQQGTEAFAEADDVAVEPLEPIGVIFLFPDLYDVNGSYGLCFGADLVQIGHDSLFVWNGNVQPSRFGVLFQYLGKQVY